MHREGPLEPSQMTGEGKGKQWSQIIETILESLERKNSAWLLPICPEPQSKRKLI